VRAKNTDRDTANTTYKSKSIANSNLDSTVILTYNDRLVITISTSFSPKDSESDNKAILDKKRQLYLLLLGNSIASPPGKQSHSLSGLYQADGCSSNWVFNVFTKDNSRIEGDGPLFLKRT
jgi:hypothetical protein